MVSSIIVHAQENNDDTHDLTIVIPEVALIDIEPSGSKDFTLQYTAPSEAGLAISNPTPNSSLWLNYSSTKSATDPTRSVLVKISAAITGGISFSVFAPPPVGGIGQVAITPGFVSLSTTNTPLLFNIGSCYTGNGVGAGHNLTYSSSYSVGSYADVRASNQTITVTYTLTDN